MATRKPKAVEAESLPVAAPAPAKKPRSTKPKADAPVVVPAEAPAVKRASKPKAAAAATPALTPEERYRQVAEAAYYIAEKRGFAPGNPSDDWYQAEAEVDGKTAG